MTRRLDEPCPARVHFVSAHRRPAAIERRFRAFGTTLTDAKKFPDCRKISSTPELKYFGLGSLLSLRRAHRRATGTSIPGPERSDSMHIAQIAPLTEAVPPKLYGGTERVVSWLTEELVALGHDVTLFASGDSLTSAKLEAVWPRALRLDGSVRDPNALHMLMLERVRQRAGDFDFLHFHLDYYPFSLFSRQSTPFVTTLHGRLDLPEHQPVFDTFSHGAGGLDLQCAAAAAAAGALGAHDPSRPARAAADAAAGQAALFRVSRPHRAGEGRRSRDPDRAALRHAAQDRRQGRQCRSRLLRRADQAADQVGQCRIYRRDQATRRNRRS